MAKMTVKEILDRIECQHRHLVLFLRNGETFDPEKGLAMAISKKALGNQGRYFNTIKKWTEPYLERERELSEWAKSVWHRAIVNLQNVLNPNPLKSDDKCQSK